MKTLLYRLKDGWLFISRILGRISTVILLTLIYVLVIGPMALWMKLTRKDLLQRRYHPDKTTCWLERTSNEPTVERHTFQF